MSGIKGIVSATILIGLIVVSCAKKANSVFPEMAGRVKLNFMSDTVNNVISLKKPCTIKFDGEKVIGQYKYSKLKTCAADNDNLILWVRREGERVFFLDDAFGEQLLFDFDAQIGQCWTIRTLDVVKVCIERKYVDSCDTIIVHHLDHINNVSDFPVVNDYHVGSRAGIIRIKFSDGTYSAVQ